MKLEDAFLDFIQYCLFEKGLTDQTISSYKNDLNIYISFLKDCGVSNVLEIKSDMIKEFLKSRGNESSGTIAHNLTVIKNFHKYLVKENIVKEDASLFISRTKLKNSITRALSDEEVYLLLHIHLVTPFDYSNKAMLE